MTRAPLSGYSLPYQNTVIETIPNVSQYWKFDPEGYLERPPHSRDYPPLR